MALHTGKRPEAQCTWRRNSPARGVSLAAHRDAIRLDPRLFARIGVLRERRDELGLDPDQEYLLERTYTAAVLAGARLVLARAPEDGA